MTKKRVSKCMPTEDEDESDKAVVALIEELKATLHRYPTILVDDIVYALLGVALEQLASIPDESDTSRKHRLDAMALKLARQVDGEDALDVAAACAGMISFALRTACPDKDRRVETLDMLVAFMMRDLGLVDDIL